MGNPYRHPISTPVPELQGVASIASTKLASEDGAALREAAAAVSAWVRWADGPNMAFGSDRKLHEVPGMLRTAPDDRVISPQLAPGEPKLTMGKLRALDAALAPAEQPVEVARLVEAASAVISRMFSTYKARNGREVGIQGDDGEKCWIVHSDDIGTLQGALLPFAALSLDANGGGL